MLGSFRCAIIKLKKKVNLEERKKDGMIKMFEQKDELIKKRDDGKFERKNNKRRYR